MGKTLLEGTGWLRGRERDEQSWDGEQDMQGLGRDGERGGKEEPGGFPMSLAVSTGYPRLPREGGP